MVEAEAKYVCANCGSHATKRCGGCEQVRYCNQTCLMRHWPEHKLLCKDLKVVGAEAKAAKVAAKVAAEEKAEAESVKASASNVRKGRKCEEEHGNCWTCGADNPTEMCGACSLAKYCDVECQRENWPIHKRHCADFQRNFFLIQEAKKSLKALGSNPAPMAKILCDKDPLSAACSLGRVTVVKRIIASGVIVNRVCQHPDSEGLSPLHCASQYGHFFLVDILIEHGALVNMVNYRKFTPLHSACQNGHVKAAAALLRHGAQIEAKTTGGTCPLLWAAQDNHPELVALLLQEGAHVDSLNFQGITPLGISGVKGHVACVRLLLQAGADPLHRAIDGRTILDVATASNHPDVVALLQARIDQLVRERLAQRKPST